MAQLKEIFEVTYGTKFDYNKMTPKIDGVAFVSRTSKNNGVVDFVDYYNEIEPIESGNITVSLGGSYVLSAFVQLYDFYTAQNVAVLKPLDKSMSLNEKLFYCQCITANRHKYSAFGREANSTLKFLEVPDRKDIPQWVNNKIFPTMDSIPKYFLEEGYDKACWYLDSVNQEEFERKYKEPVNSHKITILNTDSWKTFKLDSLFHIYTGGDLIMSSLDEGEYNVVSHSKIDNGVSATTQEIEGRKLFNCETTLSLADRGNFFATIQISDFYIGTRVKALEAKFTNANRYKLMFIATMINQEVFRFSYGRNCCDKVGDLTIKLPIKIDKANNPILDDEGNMIPDYEYMELYIKSLSYSKAI